MPSHHEEGGCSPLYKVQVIFVFYSAPAGRTGERAGSSQRPNLTIKMLYVKNKGLSLSNQIAQSSKAGLGKRGPFETGERRAGKSEVALQH